MVFNAAPCIQYYTRPPAFLFSAHANHLLLHPLHRASRDSRRAATRPGEQDSCGEIELNLEMNIESNELSTSQPPSQPSLPCRRAEAVTLLSGPWRLSSFAYWHYRLVSRNLFTCI